MTIIPPSSGTAPASPLARVSGGKPTGSADFAVADPTQAPAATPPRPIHAADLQRSLLSLQDAPDPRDEKARRGAKGLLTALAALQLRLLAGCGPDDEAEPLRALAHDLDALPQAADPRLAAAIRAIALRVRVELARRGSD